MCFRPASMKTEETVVCACGEKNPRVNTICSSCGKELSPNLAAPGAPKTPAAPGAPSAPKAPAAPAPKAPGAPKTPNA